MYLSNNLLLYLCLIFGMFPKIVIFYSPNFLQSHFEVLNELYDCSEEISIKNISKIQDLSDSSHNSATDNIKKNKNPNTIVINEILTNNSGSITNYFDEDGDSPDYIELYNNSNTAIDLSEWKLIDSDDIWIFPPNTSIAANSFLTVWASGKDRTSPQLHTNFSLSSNGEYLGLYDDNNILITEFGASYPKQFNNLSYGYTSNGNLSYFNVATPGAANTNATLGQVSQPKANFGRGFYTATIIETLTVPDTQAEIRYTTNGTIPTANSTLYNNSITINPNSTGVFTIRAKAFKSGYEPSDEVTFSYIFPDALYSGLPAQGLWAIAAIVINTDDQVYPDDVNKSRHAIELVELDGTKEGFGVTAGAKEFGESSVEFEKSNFRVFFDTEYGVSDLEYDIFENFEQGHIKSAKKFDKIELRGGSWDSWQAAAGGRFTPSDYYICDRFVKDTRLDMGDLAPHGRFVNVFVNGDYRGFYQLRERYDHQFYSSYSKNNEKPKTIEAIKENNGRYSNNGDLNINGDGSVFLSLGNNYQTDKSWINTNSFIDYTLVTSLMESDFEKEHRGVGSMMQNSPNDYHFIYGDNDMRLRPVSSVLSHMMGYSPGYFVNDLIPYFTTYKNDPEFVQDVLERTARHFCSGGALTVDSMVARIMYWKNQIDLPMRAEHERWEGQASINYTGSNYVADKYGSWNNNMNSILQRIPQLQPNMFTEWAAQGLYQGCDIRPQVDTENQISEINQATSYVIDAYDPDGDIMIFSVVSGLPPGLNINTTTGEIYGTPIQLGSYTVKIKVGDSNNKWGYHEFIWEIINLNIPVGGQLVINEIHYNPLDSVLTNGAAIDNDNFEFIELKNTGTADAVLLGNVFTKGIDLHLYQPLVIPPDSFAVFAKDSLWFKAKYGFSPDAEYNNKLDNGGEYIRLKSPYKAIIDSLTYDNNNGWDTIPDGSNYSLALINSNLDNAQANNWAAQSVFVTPREENVFCRPINENAQVAQISCNNNNDGFIALSPSNGTPPYSYQWSNNDISSTITSLTPGQYDVIITDNFLCETTANFTISEPPLLQVTVSSSDETNFNANDGIATVTPAGGTPPYNFSWSNGAISQSINNLSPGNYTVDVSDVNGCALTQNISIQTINCPVNFIQNSQPNIESGVYEVANYIQSNGIVDNGNNVSFKAGQYIQLTDNFEVKPSAGLELLIENCQ